ncbi:unnamed protein product [Leuciscus chuanchicus]
MYSHALRDCHLSPKMMYVCRGPDGTLGFDRVVGLAWPGTLSSSEKSLVPQIGKLLGSDIVWLWDRLLDSDKQGVSDPQRHKDRLIQGRFKATQSKNLHLP